MSDARVPKSRMMFSGNQPTPMTHRASISFDGLSILISPDRMPSASSDFICRTRLANNQPGFGVSGGLPHPRELDAELVTEAVQHVGVDPGQRVQLLDRRRIGPQHVRPPNATFSPNDCMMDASSSSFEPINRYTVPVPSPAADAMSLMVVTS